MSRYILRFSRTERTLHWVNALYFSILLGTGLILYLPSLAAEVGRRPLIKDIHFWTGVSWLPALAVIVVLGDRKGVLRTTRELDSFDGDDLRWLAHRSPAPQGRFNAGQKLNAAIVEAIGSAEMRKRFADMGLEAKSSTPEEFGKFLQAEVKRWGALLAKR